MQLNELLFSQFYIGIEFEFYVIKKVLKEKINKPSKILYMISYEDAGKYFLEKLNLNYPEENWIEIFDMTFDASLTTNGTKVGVEMILKHDIGTKSFQRMSQILKVLNSSEFMTEKNCAIHFNISFINELYNTPDLVFSILPHIDIENTLKQFHRDKNELSQPNLKSKIYKEDLNEAIFQPLLMLLQKKTKKNGFIIEDIYRLIQSLPENKKIEKNLNMKLLKLWQENRPAIAPRIANKKHYIEFRAIGGKDYQYKLKEIQAHLINYIEVMEKIVIKSKLKKLVDNKN